MITGRDPTPQEREKSYRLQRRNFISLLVLVAVWLGDGIFGVMRADRFAYISFGVAAFGVAVALYSWSRVRRYRV